MENEKSIENQHGAEASRPVQEPKKILDAYRGTVEQLSNVLRTTTLVELVKNPEKLKAYEEIIIDVIDKIERLGRSPPGWSFKKSEVIKNLENAQVELGQAQYFLSYAKSDPRVSADSMKHIHPCRRHLDLASSLMVMIQRKKRT